MVVGFCGHGDEPECSSDRKGSLWPSDHVSVAVPLPRLTERPEHFDRQPPPRPPQVPSQPTRCPPEPVTFCSEVCGVSEFYLEESIK